MLTTTLLIFAVGFTIVLAVTVWAANKAISTLVRERHEAIDEITRTGQVPEAWQSISKDQRKTRLNRLRAHVQTTRLIDTEHTRQAILTQLDDLRGNLRS